MIFSYIQRAIFEVSSILFCDEVVLCSICLITHNKLMDCFAHASLYDSFRFISPIAITMRTILSVHSRDFAEIPHCPDLVPNSSINFLNKLSFIHIQSQF